MKYYRAMRQGLFPVSWTVIPQPTTNPNAGRAWGTCVGARQGAEETGELAVAIVHLHHVVEGCVEEGELSKYNCGGDMARSQWGRPGSSVRGKDWRSGGPRPG